MNLTTFAKAISSLRASLAGIVVGVGVMTAATSASAISLDSAVDISVGDFVAYVEILSPGDTASLTATALEDLRIDIFGFTGLATPGSTDLTNVKFGFTSPPLGTFDFISGPVGGASLPGISLLAGESFSIFWEYVSGSGPVSIAASFAVVAPSVIPLPAGGMLLLTGLFGLAMIKRRKAVAA